MAWTTAKTFTAGMVIGATDLNTYLRDNMNQLKTPPFGRTACNPTGVANISTTSTVWTAISAGISLTLTTYGGALHCGFLGVMANAPAYLAFEVDGTAYTGIHPSGIFKTPTDSFGIVDWVTEITASGSHTIRPAWRVINAATTAQLSCSAQPAIFWVREG
jgi:hypothetical protein